MKEFTFKTLVSVLPAAFVIYFGKCYTALLILVFVMAADYISGVVKAWITKTVSSRTGIVGIVKKTMYLLVASVGFIADWLIAYFSGNDLNCTLGLLVTVWLIVNEGISILENLGEIGIPLPSFLLNALQKLKGDTENKGDK